MEHPHVSPKKSIHWLNEQRILDLQSLKEHNDADYSDSDSQIPINRPDPYQFQIDEGDTDINFDDFPVIQINE